jgi:hypothetical protein
MEAFVLYWGQLILGLYGVWISWRDGTWWLALLTFILPFAGLIVAIAYLLGVNIPKKILGTDTPTT